MKFASLIVVAVAASMLCACATDGGDSLVANPLANEADWSPKVDMTGVVQANYDKDLADCRTIADNSKAADKGSSVKKNAAVGGLLGAGAVAGLAVMTGGLALVPLAAGAAVTAGASGAAAGAIKGSSSANAAYKQTVNGCLSGKGYKVST